jgi:F-type H+-transporting ATPase subunit gamma
MMDRLADVSAQIQNVRQLESVVTALRGIAASRAQQARSLLAGIDAYSTVVSRAIGEALALLPAGSQRSPDTRRDQSGLILFCAEQGFAGAFSERVLNAAGPDLATAMTFVIGTRGLIIARERGLSPAWSAAMASHVQAVPSLANDIADALYAQIATGKPPIIEMVVPRSTSGGGILIERQSLLPLDLAQFSAASKAVPPLTTLKPQELLERLTAEYVYARLCAAAMHAYEAENQARLMTMTAARHNIGGRLTALTQHERQIRQDDITNEIVELATGAEALGDGLRN